MFPRLPARPAGSDRIEVDVGVAARPPERDVPVGLALVGVVPPGTAVGLSSAPGALVRRSDGRAGAGFVEQLRVRSHREARLLPGLRPRGGSLLRDAAVLALDAGAPWLDVVLVQGLDLRPWELADEALPALLDPFFEHLYGTILLFPDALGPAQQVGGRAEDGDEAWARIHRLTRTWRAGWSSRYQIALLDTGPDPARNGELWMGRLLGCDAALCRWTGDVDALRTHGWRSAAAAVGGALLAQRSESHRGPTGTEIPLGRGRRPAPLPRPHRPARRSDPDEPSLEQAFCTLEVRPDGAVARVRSEPTLRRPRQGWTLASLRTAKLVHQRIVQAADAIVFKPANEAHAFALVAAIDQAIRPFVQSGLLVGPDGEGTPSLESGVIRDPAQPGLVATVTGQLRPWCNKVQVRVDVRNAGKVDTEVRQ